MRMFYTRVDTRHLETLLWVVRLGGVGAAAQHLNLTQPAVTRRIQELERELGAKVLRRQGRNVVATAIGETCLSSAERILSEVATLRVAASGKAAVGTIRVGVVESIALTWFQNFLARIEERYPKVQLEIDVDLSNRLANKLARRQIDIALLPGPIQLPGVVRVSLGSCAMKWLGHPGLRPADREMTAADLAELPIIGMPQDANAYHSIIDWFEEAQVSPTLVHRCNSFSVVALLVRRGVGVSLLPPDLFAGDLESGALQVLIEHPAAPKVEYSAAYLLSVEVSILPEVAAIAREESWFFGSPRARGKNFGTGPFPPLQARALPATVSKSDI
ncbi:LysR family transcriptional regulator [Bradyrhizobium canariense]|uniref:Transcriptional regulator, LysR family n=1 Tax=Bradyrhizobium canariense TaxID=255045 RepID=A0A1H1WM58_9BRAD|nr:transcriptional regulator, LysR family [Bradyrhizobium canariense]